MAPRTSPLPIRPRRFGGPHRNGLYLFGLEIDLVQVDYADAAALESVEEVTKVLHVGGGGPVREFIRRFAVVVRPDCTKRNIELIQQMERFLDTFICRGRGNRRLLEGQRPDEARRRRKVAGQPQQSRPVTDLRQPDVCHVDRRCIFGIEMNVVAQVRQVPVERRRVGHDAKPVLVDLELPIDVLEHGTAALGIVNEIVVGVHGASCGVVPAWMTRTARSEATASGTVPEVPSR